MKQGRYSMRIKLNPPIKKCSSTICSICIILTSLQAKQSKKYSLSTLIERENSYSIRFNLNQIQGTSLDSSYRQWAKTLTQAYQLNNKNNCLEILPKRDTKQSTMPKTLKLRKKSNTMKSLKREEYL